MTELIKQQFLEFAVILYAGGVSAFLFKTFAKFKEKYPVGSITTIFQNVLFWIFLALATSTFLDFANFGDITFYIVGVYILGWITAIAFDKFANS